jgi:molybdate transport system substrate-binding protein
MKRRTAARWLLTLASIVGLLVVPPASAAELHVMISAGFFQVYAELVPRSRRAPAIAS